MVQTCFFNQVKQFYGDLEILYWNHACHIVLCCLQHKQSQTPCSSIQHIWTLEKCNLFTSHIALYSCLRFHVGEPGGSVGKLYDACVSDAAHLLWRDDIATKAKHLFWSWLCQRMRNGEENSNDCAQYSVYFSQRLICRIWALTWHSGGR